MVTLYRYSASHEAGDLTQDDLHTLWDLLCSEGLVETFFHDGTVRSKGNFVNYAANADNWFYAAKQDGVFIGFMVFNNFSSSGNTAFVHLCSFAAGRKKDADGNVPFEEACQLCMDLVKANGHLEYLLAIIPKVYRGVRHWAMRFGLEQIIILPDALKLRRSKGKSIITNGIMYCKVL